MILHPCRHGEGQQACGYRQSLTSHRVLKDTKNSEKDTKNSEKDTKNSEDTKTCASTRNLILFCKPDSIWEGQQTGGYCKSLNFDGVLKEYKQNNSKITSCS